MISIVSSVLRPCATARTAWGERSCSAAHRSHVRSTISRESTSVPSMSKSTASHATTDSLMPRLRWRGAPGQMDDGASGTGSRRDQRLRCVHASTHDSTALVHGLKLPGIPPPDAVERGEREIWRNASLAADQFAAAPDVVLHPCRNQEVIGVAL